MAVRWPAWLAVRRGLASSKASMMLTPRSRPAIQSRLSRPAGGAESSLIMVGSVPLPRVSKAAFDAGENPWFERLLIFKDRLSIVCRLQALQDHAEGTIKLGIRPLKERLTNGASR